MMLSKILAGSAVLFSSLAAAGEPFSTLLPPPRMKTCVVPSNYASSDGTASDMPAITKAFAECSKDAVIEFPMGVEYNVFEPLVANNLSNVVIDMKGNWNLPQNVTFIQSLVNATTGGSLYWLQLGGKDVSYLGTSNATTGWIKSYGTGWWGLNPINGTGVLARPHLIAFNVTNGYMNHFKSWKPIAWNMQVMGQNITIENAVVDAIADEPMYYGINYPFNTDAFDVSGNDITIRNAVIANGDDAYAIQSPSRNVVVEGGYIGFQSHGMNIGSLGGDQAESASVSDVVFDGVTVINTVYGARFKSWEGGQGLAKNVTWKNINVFNVTYPIYVTQTYFDQGTGTGSGRPNNSSVIMEDFTWANFTGNINTFNPGDGSCVSDPCWYDIGLDYHVTDAVIIECNTEQSCKNFALENIELYTQNMQPANQICINATTSLNPRLGIDCVNGTFVPRS